jgi:methylglutaconyl-CoA hydratase
MSEVRTEDAAGVRTITFARSQRKNALTPAMLSAITSAANPPESVRVLHLTGEGDAFSSGFDMELCKDDPRVLATLLRGLADAIAALRGCRCPVVASVGGAAIAGGCALLSACDVVLALAEAKLGYPVVRLGISPAVNAPSLSQAVWPGAARARTLDSALITGAEALRIGLVHECLPDAESLARRSVAVCASLAEKPPHALAATKAWVRAVSGQDASEVSAALEASLGLVGGVEERERLAQFWKKPARKDGAP